MAHRDLELLSEQGRVQRLHVGAIKLQTPPEKPRLERSTAQPEGKRRIDRIAADLISDGKTIFLGSGTNQEVTRIVRNT